MRRQPRATILWLAAAAALAGCGDTLGLAIGEPEGVNVRETLLAVDVHSGGLACAAGEGAVYLRSPSAQGWRAMPLNATDANTLEGLHLRAVLCLDPNTVLAVGGTTNTPSRPQIALFTRGTPWTLKVQQPKPGGALFALARAGAKGVVASGYRHDGTPSATSRSWNTTSMDPVKESWKDEPGLNSDHSLRALWVRPDGQRVAAGNSGLLLHSSGPGKPYMPQNSPYGAAPLTAAWAPGNGPFMVAGLGGAMISQGKAGAWKPTASSKFSANWHGLHGTSPSNIFAVGGLVIAHNDGRGWKKLTNITGLPASLDLQAVRVDPGGANAGRLHLAGDKLLATCTIIKSTPPSLTCGP